MNRNCNICGMVLVKGHSFKMHPPKLYTPSQREIQAKAAQGLVRDYVKNEWVLDPTGEKLVESKERKIV